MAMGICRCSDSEIGRLFCKEIHHANGHMKTLNDAWESCVMSMKPLEHFENPVKGRCDIIGG